MNGFTSREFYRVFVTIINLNDTSHPSMIIDVDLFIVPELMNHNRFQA